MEAILQSWPRLLRSIILIGILGGIVYSILNRFLDSFYSDGEFSIETTEKGGFVFKVTKRNGKDSLTRYTQFLLPSNECWYDTGLDINAGETCEIKVTGTVHLAIDKLVEAVSVDTLPLIKWTGPEGNEWSKLGDTKECQDAKEKLLLQPGRFIGNVVGFFYTEYDLKDKQFITYFLKNRQQINKRGEVFTVGKGGSFPNTSKTKARLYLSINDIMLDLTDTAAETLSKKAYVERGYLKDIRLWDKIKSQPDYYRLWFDDNIGGFLVNVTIAKK